ncbi:hypothetical protein BDW22DRAFT_1424727 [Trametopsis cervina]|nr:hypothetical protein BDW22DRAFT_1424727 [Trametopsis cervina]
MATVDPWADFDTVRHNVKLNTVDRLKQILISFNDQCGTNFTKSGKKQELIDRITRELDSWRHKGNTERWNIAKGILNHVRGSIHNSYRPNTDSQFGQFHASGTMYHGANSIPHYDPYAQRRQPVPSGPAASTSSAANTGIQFKPSPFFRVEKVINSPVECPESTSQMDRRSQSLSFLMNADLASKLDPKSSKYQLRLYCTSSTYYSPTPSFRSNTGPCPIEFPPTCEVRVNGTQLAANLKGMKKKPGTAPPPNLGQHLKVGVGMTNRIDMVYVNSQQPTTSKKYYLVVMLVEVTTVEQLIDRLKKGKFRSSADILAKMVQAASEDDDIIAGHQKMSLKCPLSYARIVTPCRSSSCVHSQCFDASAWFQTMEQNTTWLCPVCEKVLDSEELIVDGYFDEILNSTSEDVEDIIVEADGQWHTADNKYASAAWKAAHPPVLSLPPAPVKKRSPTPMKLLAGGEPPKPTSEIVILDSDDEEEGQVKRELSPSVTRSLNASLASIGSLPPRSQTGESDVIDLTLDSDDEEPPLARNKKRKAGEPDVVSPTEQIWKKSRTDVHSLPSKPMPVSSSGGYPKGAPYSPPRDSRVLPPISPGRYMSRPSPGYSSSYIPPGGAPVHFRPPIPRADSYPDHPLSGATSNSWPRR